MNKLSLHKSVLNGKIFDQSVLHDVDIEIKEEETRRHAPTPRRVDLYRWRKNRQFNSFLFGSRWIGAKSMYFGVSMNSSSGSSKSPQQQKRPSSTTGTRLVDLSRKRATRHRDEVRQMREHRILEEERRSAARELSRCAKQLSNRVSKGLTAVLDLSCGSQVSVTIAALAAVQYIRRKATSLAVITAVTSLMGISTVALSPRRPLTPSAVARRHLFKGREWSNNRRYHFRPLSANSLRPRTTPPPLPRTPKPRGASPFAMFPARLALNNSNEEHRDVFL